MVIRLSICCFAFTLVDCQLFRGNLAQVLSPYLRPPSHLWSRDHSEGPSRWGQNEAAASGSQNEFTFAPTYQSLISGQTAPIHRPNSHLASFSSISQPKYSSFSPENAERITQPVIPSGFRPVFPSKLENEKESGRFASSDFSPPAGISFLPEVLPAERPFHPIHDPRNQKPFQELRSPEEPGVFEESGHKITDGFLSGTGSPVNQHQSLENDFSLRKDQERVPPERELDPTEFSVPNFDSEMRGFVDEEISEYSDDVEEALVPDQAPHHNHIQSFAPHPPKITEEETDYSRPIQGGAIINAPVRAKPQFALNELRFGDPYSGPRPEHHFHRPPYTRPLPQQQQSSENPYNNPGENGVPVRIIEAHPKERKMVDKRRPYRKFQLQGSSGEESSVVPQYRDYDEGFPDEEEEKKPDRLSVLLLQTSFNCQKRKDGYYADEELQCEVFHFCQNQVKYSWLCPDQSSFHQVHLICLPRTEDNICEKSSKFHFVNDYLYKEAEGSSGRNRSYLQRYYPKGYEEGIAMLEQRQVIQSESHGHPGIQNFQEDGVRYRRPLSQTHSERSDLDEADQRQIGPTLTQEETRRHYSEANDNPYLEDYPFEGGGLPLGSRFRT